MFNLATDGNSPAHYAKGTQSPVIPKDHRAPTACKCMVSGTFNSPNRGRALVRSKALPGYFLEINSEYYYDYLGSQTAGDNIRGQKGNNPDRRLRSPMYTKCLRKLDCTNSQDVGLEAATI